MLVIECFFSLCSAAQSYDNGFGQGAGRESHGEYHHLLLLYSWLQISDPDTRQPRFKSLSYGDHWDFFFFLVKRFIWDQNVWGCVGGALAEGMKVADGSYWFKGLTIKISVDTLSSLIPPPLKLNLIILTQKPSAYTHTHTLWLQSTIWNISAPFDMVKVEFPVNFVTDWMHKLNL